MSHSDPLDPSTLPYPALPGPRLPLRYGLTWHETALHIAVGIGAFITLCGGRPALAINPPDRHTGTEGPLGRYLLGVTCVLFIGCLTVVTGVIWRKLAGNLNAIILEIVGLLLAAAGQLAYAYSALAKSPSHNYTTYLILVAFSVANLGRVRQCRRDLKAAARIAPKE
jgi:hypothetical protein